MPKTTFKSTSRCIPGRETLQYLKCFLKDKHVASVCPTSRSGVRNVCRKIDFSKDAVFVEYGAATGVFTRYLLEKATPGSRVIAIELNEGLYRQLVQGNRDPRLSAVNGSAEDVLDILAERGHAAADYVISGIPFLYFPQALKDRILENTRAALAPGGQFLLYQTFWQTRDVLLDPLAERFRKVSSRYELRNIPPLRIYQADA